MLFVHDRLYAEQSFSFVIGVLIYETDYRNKWQNLSSANQIAVTACGLVTGFLFLMVKQIGIISEETYLIYNVEQLLIKLPVAISLLLGTSIMIRHKAGWSVLKGYGLLAPITIEIYLVHVYVLSILERYELSNWTYLAVFSLLCVVGVVLLKAVEYIVNKSERRLLK